MKNNRGAIALMILIGIAFIGLIIGQMISMREEDKVFDDLNKNVPQTEYDRDIHDGNDGHSVSNHSSRYIEQSVSPCRSSLGAGMDEDRGKCPDEETQVKGISKDALSPCVERTSQDNAGGACQ